MPTTPTAQRGDGARRRRALRRGSHCIFKNRGYPVVAHFPCQVQRLLVIGVFRIDVEVLVGQGMSRKRRDFLNPEGGSDHHRTMVVPLQFEQAAQRIELSPLGSRSHRPDGPKTGHALAFTLDHSKGANQFQSRYHADLDTVEEERQHLLLHPFSVPPISHKKTPQHGV